MTASVGTTESIVSQQADELIEEIKSLPSAKMCVAHDKMVEATVQNLRISQLFLSYVENPMFKILIAVYTLGGISAVVLVAIKVAAAVSTGQITP